NHLTTTQQVNWIREGDIEEAKQLGSRLAQFLDNLAQNKAAQRALYRVRIFTTLGTEELSLIAEKLRDDPSINMEAKRKFTEIIQAGYPKKGSEEFAKAREL